MHSLETAGINATGLHVVKGGRVGEVQLLAKLLKFFSKIFYEGPALIEVTIVVCLIDGI